MVLHALRREVGDDDFFEILREWVARYNGQFGDERRLPIARGRGVGA